MRPGRRMWTKRKCWPGMHEAKEQVWLHEKTSDFPETSGSYHLTSAMSFYGSNLTYISPPFLLQRFFNEEGTSHSLNSCAMWGGAHAVPCRACLNQTHSRDIPPKHLSPQNNDLEGGKKRFCFRERGFSPLLNSSIWSNLVNNVKRFQRPGS